MKISCGTFMSNIKETASSTHIIVMGNEKGGSGKSTTTMHLAIALLRDGWRVGTIDLDGQQATLTRYFENRMRYMKREGLDLPVPEHYSIAQAQGEFTSGNQDEEYEALKLALERLSENCEIIIIDTPGSENHLMRMGHMMADTLVTPVNDSFLDLDVMGTVDNETQTFLEAGSYSRMACNCRERQMDRYGQAFNWVVMRNRMSNLQANNKIQVSSALRKLSEKLDFTLIEGLHERVIFRELFPLGLTMLDTTPSDSTMKISMSHIAARQEIRNLVEAINLPMTADKAKAQRLFGANATLEEIRISNFS